jgi:hypothetical protein
MEEDAMNEGRKVSASVWVKVDGKNEKIWIEGVFHKWGTTFEEFSDGAVEATIGIIEVADGKIYKAFPEDMKFDPPNHKQRHIILHKALDELFADYIDHHPGEKDVLHHPLERLITWSYSQTINPKEKGDKA